MRRHREIHLLVLLVACVTACGGDDSAAVGQAGGPGGPAPAAAGSGGQLVPKLHIEDRVTDAERATIRHQFHDRDFLDSNRDPFTSTMLSSAGSGSAGLVPAKVVECHSRIIAPNYSYADLKLVGIVHQGIQNKVLMMDPNNLGRIISTGECVGKEKAVVKEITQNHVTFLVTPESGPGQGMRPAEEYSVKLHEHDLDTTTQTDLSQPNPEPEAAPVLPSNGRPPNGPGPVPTTPSALPPH
jgi:Tfp pilus assembly protein PilP